MKESVGRQHLDAKALGEAHVLGAEMHPGTVRTPGRAKFSALCIRQMVKECSRCFSISSHGITLTIENKQG